MRALVSQAREQGLPLAVLMADIDRFKDVNDRHGHQVGDRLINSVVGTLLMTLRPTDCLCRMGGEEFAIVLPEHSLAQAVAVAERIRATIELERVALEESGDAYLKITLSLGVAMLEPKDVSMFDVLGRADKALNRAKAGGRNRLEVQTADAEPARPERWPCRSAVVSRHLSGAPPGR